MKKIFRIMALLMTVITVLSALSVFSYGEKKTVDTLYASAPATQCTSAILIEAKSGQVLYEKNADEPLPPASVTKIMTLLLVMEAIEAKKIKLTDTVSASAHACSMGGSQIYLKEGEQMSVDELLKSVVIASANDAAVALAEHVAGSEESFVAQMNLRAAELGMKNTSFENTNGLDDTAKAHLTSARDIALMSQELIKHKKILEYSSVWMDTIRDGKFGLTNTNRLIRFYKGATGLKTGSTSKAGFCISATAEREDMSLICVIMGAPTRDVRNASATALLDWGFANYTLYESPEIVLEPIRVLGGKRPQCTLEYEHLTTVVEKKGAGLVEYRIELPKEIDAPIRQGDKIGVIKYTSGGTEIGCVDIIANEKIDKASFFDIFLMILCAISIN